MSDRMPLRVLRAAAAAALVAVALAACVGIPSSGGVNVGGPIKANGPSLPSADLPLPPRKGESKQEILTDFMQAATSPDGDYQIAQLFLTKAAAHSWNPTKSVLIRSGAPNPQPQPNGTIDYPVTTKASVDATGVYSAQSTPSTQLLKFSFEKVGGQWRISRLADGTVISSTSFAAIFSSQALYFFDPTYHYLVPDVRWFPTGTTQPTRIVSALLAGPSPWLQGGAVATAFPQGVQLASPVEVRSSSAVVNMTAAAQAAKPLDRARMLQQLQESLRDVDVTSPSMTVRGAPLTVSDPGESNAVPAIAVDSSALVGDGKKFGFAPRMQPIGKVSAQVVALGATAVTLDRSQTRAAVLALGGVYLVSNNVAKPTRVDGRTGLIAPSIDPFGYVWSVPGSDATAIRAEGSDGVEHAITSAIPTHSTIAALVVSHDGARVLLYLNTPSGPRLDVAGILRHGSDNAPIGIGPLLDLPASSSIPIGATWIDDRSVAALAESSGVDEVTTFTIGGVIGDTTTVDEAVQIAGGSTEDGLRVLTTGGQVQQLRSSGWQNSGTTATVLATQQ